MAKVVRRIQTRKNQTPRSKKMRDFRGNDFSDFKGPRYSRKMKHRTEW